MEVCNIKHGATVLFVSVNKILFYLSVEMYSSKWGIAHSNQMSSAQEILLNVVTIKLWPLLILPYGNLSLKHSSMRKSLLQHFPLFSLYVKICTTAKNCAKSFLRKLADWPITSIKIALGALILPVSILFCGMFM